MRALIAVFQVTLIEAARRRIVLAAVLCGLGFVALFATGFHFVAREMAREGTSLIERRMFFHFVTLAGLYAASRLGVLVAVLVPVDTLSGEIASGVMQTMASKPVRRSTILLGKWLASLLIVACYLLLISGGVLLVARLIGGIVPPRAPLGFSLMMLESAVMATLSIAGGTRLGTIANGITAFGLYGVAFIGSWVEQIGAHVGNEASRYIGTVSSLIIPSEAMWQLAAHHMQPSIMRDMSVTPFSPASVPSPAMVAWACGYVVVVLALGMLAFRRRPL